MKGIDPKLAEVFSTRRKQVKARLSELGISSKRSAEIAALETRSAKSPSRIGAADGPESLRTVWWRHAESAGLDPIMPFAVDAAHRVASNHLPYRLPRRPSDVVPKADCRTAD